MGIRPGAFKRDCAPKLRWTEWQWTMYRCTTKVPSWQVQKPKCMFTKRDQNNLPRCPSARALVGQACPAARRPVGQRAWRARVSGLLVGAARSLLVLQAFAGLHLLTPVEFAASLPKRWLLPASSGRLQAVRRRDRTIRGR